MRRDEEASPGSLPQSPGTMSRRPSMPFKAEKVRGVNFLLFFNVGIMFQHQIFLNLIFKMITYGMKKCTRRLLYVL